MQWTEIGMKKQPTYKGAIYTIISLLSLKKPNPCSAIYLYEIWDEMYTLWSIYNNNSRLPQKNSKVFWIMVCKLPLTSFIRTSNVCGSTISFDFGHAICMTLAELGPLHTQDWEPVTITFQALSLVEKAEPVQVHFTLCLRDRRSI